LDLEILNLESNQKEVIQTKRRYWNINLEVWLNNDLLYFSGAEYGQYGISERCILNITDLSRHCLTDLFLKEYEEECQRKDCIIVSEKEQLNVIKNAKSVFAITYPREVRYELGLYKLYKENEPTIIVLDSYPGFITKITFR